MGNEKKITELEEKEKSIMSQERTEKQKKRDKKERLDANRALSDGVIFQWRTWQLAQQEGFFGGNPTMKYYCRDQPSFKKWLMQLEELMKAVGAYGNFDAKTDFSRTQRMKMLSENQQMLNEILNPDPKHQGLC